MLQHEQSELKRARTPRVSDTRSLRARSTPPLRFADWILWQDDALIAVDKPAGVASQGGDGLAGNNLVDLARAHFKADHVAVLHRIDRNVSGIVLLAKTSSAARAMSSLIARGQLERRYEAVTKGRLTEPVVLSHWLRKDARSNQVHLREAPLDPQGHDAPADHKHTVTRVEPVTELRALIGVCTIVNAWPITGRSHQIRAQLAASGLPIIGDPKYGVEANALRRPLLHATHVRFEHPTTRVPVELSAPPPWTPQSLIKLRRKA